MPWPYGGEDPKIAALREGRDKALASADRGAALNDRVLDLAQRLEDENRALRAYIEQTLHTM